MHDGAVIIDLEGIEPTIPYFPSDPPKKESFAASSDFPMNNRTLDLILSHLKPSSEALILAPVIYSSIDSVPPAYSKRWVQDILRTQLNYQGVIIADLRSPTKRITAGDLVVRARLALDTGCDLVMLSHPDKELVKRALDRLERGVSEGSQQRLKNLANSLNFANNSASAIPVT